MTQFNDTLLNLELLAEECAEVIQAKSKLVRFGLKHTNPIKGALAIYDLENEIGDLLAIIDILVANNTVSEDNIATAKANKLNRLAHWYDKNACEKIVDE